jgi:hypothetical protein
MREKEVIRLPAGCKGGGVSAYGRMGVWACRRMGEWACRRVGVLVLVLVLVLVGGGTLVSRSPALWRGAACCQLIDLLFDTAAPRQRGSKLKISVGVYHQTPLFLKP